ncbi:MAG TPA: VWA domain-containing protein [Thermoanaerobaculia bacterium]|nr:VWA domain-containing protein [Thermoanaerobaculia bacterium]
MVSFVLFAALLLPQTTPAPAVPSSVPSVVPSVAAAPAAPLATIDLPVQILDPKGEVPRILQPGDFTVLDAGRLRPVTGLAPLNRPWRIVVYVDRVLSGSRTLRAAAGTLAEQAAGLAALGTVEVVVAEPRPRVALEATRDVQAVDEALSKLWLENEGRDDVRLLRQHFRDDKPEGGTDPAERATQAIDTETRLVRHQEDGFAEWLLSQEGEGPRVVFLVSDGFDTNPAKFYRGSLAEGEGALEKTAAETARTVSALGWTVFPVPLGDSTLPDLRRFHPRSTLKTPIGGTIDLGRKAPEVPRDEPTPPPALLAPQEPLIWLAESTGGEVLLQPSGLAAALAHLRSRFSLRYEVPRELDGRPRPLEVTTTRSDLRVHSRRWDVSGTPEFIASERGIRLLEGEDEGIGIELSSRIQPAEPAAGAGRGGTLDLRIESPQIPPGPLRVTLAGPSARGAFHHILTSADLAGAEPNVYHLPVTLPEEAEAVAVLVEPLAGGPWGGQVVTLGATAPAAAEEPAPVSVIRPGIRLVAPAGTSLTGKVRLRVNGDGQGIARVDLKLGERTAASCAKVPCEAEVDLGRRAHPQLVLGVAYDGAGKELARDWVRLNDPNQTFGVRIVEPAGRQAVGAVDVEADVRAPSGRRIEKVEMYWNDELAATLYEPPFRHKVNVPRNHPVGFLRVAARLDDGSTAEDAMPLNASDLGSRIDVRLIQLAVVVTDPTGKPVPGLPKDVFRVRQDGQPQEISAFENAGELPLTLALAIDSSASMFLKLPVVRKAVSTLLETGLTDRDRAMLIDFDSKPKLIRPVTRDLAAVEAALEQLQPDGGTALWDAITFSLAQLRGINGRKALVVYSDGIDEAERATFPICLKAARESGIPIYLIVANPREERGDDGGFLTEPASAKFRRLADAGGGQVYFLHPDEDLAAVYGQILSELRSQYTVAFYPKDTAPPAAWSKIDVEVTGRKDLTARTVSGVSARP